MAGLLDINLSITISMFLDFLSGKSIDGYGDSGKKALEVTHQVLYNTFNDELDEARASRSPNDDGILPLVDEYLLLNDILWSIEKPLRPHLRNTGFTDMIINTFES